MPGWPHWPVLVRTARSDNSPGDEEQHAQLSADHFTIFALSLSSVPIANGVTISLLPEQGKIQAGATALIDVVVSDLSASENAGAIGGYDLRVAFNPALLSWTSTAFGVGLNVTGPGDVHDSGLLSLNPAVVDTAEVSWMLLRIYRRPSPTPSCCSPLASPVLRPAPVGSR